MKRKKKQTRHLKGWTGLQTMETGWWPQEALEEHIKDSVVLS